MDMVRCGNYTVGETSSPMEAKWACHNLRRPRAGTRCGQWRNQNRRLENKHREILAGAIFPLQTEIHHGAKATQKASEPGKSIARKDKAEGVSKKFPVGDSSR